MDAQARTLASGRFVNWPKVQMQEEGKHDVKPKKAVNVAALKMNAGVLEHFVGHSYNHKEVGHVDFLHAGLTAVNAFWNDTWRLQSIFCSDFPGKNERRAAKHVDIIFFLDGDPC